MGMHPVWNCPCPFCIEFVKRHPFRYEVGHKWFAVENGRPVEVHDLRPGGGLFEAYQLFSEPVGGVLRIITSIRRASRDGRLETRAANIVRSYSKNTSPVFAQALKLSLTLATERTS
jgi:hypothetical protein